MRLQPLSEPRSPFSSPGNREALAVHRRTPVAPPYSSTTTHPCVLNPDARDRSFGPEAGIRNFSIL